MMLLLIVCLPREIFLNFPIQLQITYVIIFNIYISTTQNYLRRSEVINGLSIRCRYVFAGRLYGSYEIVHNLYVKKK